MIRSFKEDKDIYSFIASIAFNKTYEECLENLPTGEYDEDGKEIKIYQPDGKARRGEAKSVVLGRPSVDAPSRKISHYRIRDEKSCEPYCSWVCILLDVLTVEVR